MSLPLPSPSSADPSTPTIQGPPPHPQPYPIPSTPGAQGEMVTLPPPQHQPPPDYYRHPPYDMYSGHPQDPHRPGPPPHHMYAQHQPAPRQRTAIACRYCRRRKVSRNCSGPVTFFMLIRAARFAAQDSKHPKMAVAPIVSDFSRNASSRPYPPTLRPLCRPILLILI